MTSTSGCNRLHPASFTPPSSRVRGPRGGFPFRPRSFSFLVARFDRGWFTVLGPALSSTTASPSLARFLSWREWRDAPPVLAASSTCAAAAEVDAADALSTRREWSIRSVVSAARASPPAASAAACDATGGGGTCGGGTDGSARVGHSAADRGTTCTMDRGGKVVRHPCAPGGRRGGPPNPTPPPVPHTRCARSPPHLSPVLPVRHVIRQHDLRAFTRHARSVPGRDGRAWHVACGGGSGGRGLGRIR